MAGWKRQGGPYFEGRAPASQTTHPSVRHGSQGQKDGAMATRHTIHATYLHTALLKCVSWNLLVYELELSTLLLTD